ncbi:MAG TPA: putative zinc-binding peptidase [Tepidisphaeraceae bacterium]|jgi:hypothetical protein
MNVFHCDHCDNLVFFENIACLNCGHRLAYVPHLGQITSLDPKSGGTFVTPLAPDRRFKLCRNYTEHAVCNWALPAETDGEYCLSCRLTRTIPPLVPATNKPLWYKIEIAKRRLVYTLLQLGLPVINKNDDPKRGQVYDILADPADPSAPKVLTGHDDGVITLALAEADDAEREKRRLLMKEPYRTLLGHLRHEVGHYYWDLLVSDSPRLEAFRQLFGDERASYAEALQRHYQNGAPAEWQETFISAYATMHPWEDWAETWAHYLHTADTLETAAGVGIRIRPPRRGEPVVEAVPDPVTNAPVSFDKMMIAWPPLTYVLNELNRGLGVGDAYPFVLPPKAVEKLRFVHDTIHAAATAATQSGTAVPGTAPAATAR